MLIHMWNRCHACEAQPIVGLRLECQTCPAGPDRDLCQSCHSLLQQGRVKHPASGRFTPTHDYQKHLFRAVEGSAADATSRWCSVPPAFSLPPCIPDGFVVRPEFLCGRASYIGAHAFVADPGSGGNPLVFTALHVLDELIKEKGIDCSLRNHSYTGAELPQLIDNVNLYDVFADKWVFAQCGTAGPMLVLPEARTGEEEPYSQRDLAAFVVSSSPTLKAQSLAPNVPSIGDPIWVAARCGQGASSRTVAAVIVELTEEMFIFRFLDSSMPLSGASGAPLVNRYGEVVGVNCGRGVFDRHCFGHGPHILSIRRHLGA